MLFTFSDLSIANQLLLSRPYIGPSVIHPMSNTHVRKKYAELGSREVYVQEIIKQGAKRARSVAQDTMEEVRQKAGFLQA